MRFIFLYIFVLYLAGCTGKVADTYKNPKSAGNFIQVRHRDLINDPGKYHKQNIEIIGFYRTGFEKSALYPGRFCNYPQHAIWISFHQDLPLINPVTGVNLFDSYKETEKISNRNIRIRAQFSMTFKGHLEQYFAELNNVVSIEVFD